MRCLRRSECLLRAVTVHGYYSLYGILAHSLSDTTCDTPSVLMETP